MTIPLNVITRKKLLLVRQLYQRAVLQAETEHSDVDRIMSVIGLDLTNETTLKAIVSSLEPSKAPANDINGLIQQADTLLAAQGLPTIANKATVRYVHDLRNDAQHKAKYPNENDVNDCRTYTRDFLRQIIHDVWDEDFESISLVDVIKDATVKGYLVEAEAELAKSNYTQTVIKSIAAFGWTISSIKDSIVGRIPYYTRAFVVSEGGFGGRQHESTEIFEVFQHMRDTLMRSVIGVSFPGYLRYRTITQSVGGITFMEDGHYEAVLRGHTPDVKEAEYVVQFATNAIIQIESLVGDINNPFKI
jgi:hypothetical protein